MKFALWTFLAILTAGMGAYGQSYDLQCKPSLNPPTTVTESFAESYVEAFGYPAEKMTAEFLKLPLKDQYQRYVEFEVQRRVSYLRPYLNSRQCDSLSDLDVFVISLYTGSQYKILNKALRSKNLLELKKYQFLIDAITTAMEKLTPYEGVVRRGVFLTPSQQKRYCVKCTVTEHSFLSTSLNDSYGQAPNQFEIISKTGVYISPLSSAMMEEEVLFKPGTRFKVLKVKKNLVVMEEVAP